MNGKAMTATPAEVILYHPRSARAKYRVPMSLLALASMLEGEYTYRIVDGNFFRDPECELAAVIEASGAEVLAMTVMPGPQLHEAIPLVRAMKARFPHLTTIWGGYFPSNHPDTVIRSPYVDFLIRGVAEYDFLAFLRNRRQPATLADIPGLSYMQNGQPVHNPIRRRLYPLDDLPSWPYHRLGSMDRYLGRTFLGRRTMLMHTSYGCPFTCSFCAVVPIFNGRWVAQSAGRVADEVQELVARYQIDAVEFADNNFFTSVRRTAAFSEILLQRGIRVNWWAEGRPDTLLKYFDDVLASMRRAGCKMIFLGAESGSAERLRQMNKGGTQTPDTILALAEKFRRHDIVPEFSFVLGAPADDIDRAIEEEIAFIRKVKQINPASEIIIYVYSPVPLYTSSLFQQAQATGFAFPQTLEEWLAPEWRELDLRKNPRTPWLKPRHIAKILNFEAVLHGRFPTHSDVRLTARRRRLLQLSASLRYALQIYQAPYEVKLLQRYFRYRQPEVEGF